MTSKRRAVSPLRNGLGNLLDASHTMVVVYEKSRFSFSVRHWRIVRELMITVSKIVALCLALLYTAIAVAMTGLAAIPGMMILLAPPLGLIWFSEDLSEFTGYVGKGGQSISRRPSS
ncbi:hypothetical protein NZK35_18320 [Stieleria sp. ICT_E10.1]|uniref:hypothetical protein n=1 Tax=Stieleria sedimenti TaxID=2976331 RepID=UPI0021802128|nr:hypothetical protein [Stieleria sedimenti]MCS7468613.1 hypothetical protein [Stieleria sedimenti]